MSDVKLSRRNFLVGAGGMVLGLPALESVAAPCLPGLDCDAPQHFVLFHNPQGTVLDLWRPVGQEFFFELPEILSPLAPHKKDCLFIGGVDNVARGLMTVGDGHVTADTSVYTGLGFADESVDKSQLSFAGPSIDQVIAQRIQGNTPLRSLNLAISGGAAANPYTQSPFFSNGFKDPVTLIASPMEVYLTYFAGGAGNAEAQAQLLERRKSVLDAVLENFNHLLGRVSQADKILLDAHAQKVFELEQQLILLEETKLTCGQAASPGAPVGYEYWDEAWEPTTAGLQLDLMVYALSCGLTRTATIDFRKHNSPTFPFLWGEFGGPLVPTNKYDNWHGMVHTGRSVDGQGTPEPGLVRGYKWYAEMFALLLEKMKATPSGIGKNLLETSLVMWGSEFGDGIGHFTDNIPIVLAGTTGPQPMGRTLDFFDTKNQQLHCVNEVYVALLQAFGESDVAFGNHMGSPEGPLPGIL